MIHRHRANVSINKETIIIEILVNVDNNNENSPKRNALRARVLDTVLVTILYYQKFWLSYNFIEKMLK